MLFFFLAGRLNFRISMTLPLVLPATKSSWKRGAIQMLHRLTSLSCSWSWFHWSMPAFLLFALLQSHWAPLEPVFQLLKVAGGTNGNFINILKNLASRSKKELEEYLPDIETRGSWFDGREPDVRLTAQKLLMAKTSSPNIYA